MIDFPCHHCRSPCSVPAEMAGGTIQCPECGFLADIPTHGDRAAILPDGTYSLDAPEAPAVDHFADAMYAFDRNTLDASGNEKDLRPTMAQIRRAGADAPGAVDAPAHAAPKYDPETGELIRPMTLAPREEDADDIPVAKAAIHYAHPGLVQNVSPARVFIELFAPANVFVIGFIVLFHVMAECAVTAFLYLSRVMADPAMMAVTASFPAFALALLAVVILAHYACVIEDVGREEIDELPRPLRGFGFLDDLWFPFIRLFGAVVLCYAPAVVAAVHFAESRGEQLFWGSSLLVLGTILLPAVALTTLTSGALANLRPDRVLGVVRASGRRYALLVLGWGVTIPVYAAGAIFFNLAVMGTSSSPTGVPRSAQAAGVLLLVLGIYLAHAWCWQLGLLYRAKHREFPWVLQRHERKKPYRGVGK